MYTSNSASHTATVQVSLQDDHTVGSYEYMDRVREAMRRELPQLNAYFQSGGLVDAVLNLGMPAPIDIQVSGSNLEKAYETATKIAAKVRGAPRRRRRAHSAGHRCAGHGFADRSRPRERPRPHRKRGDQQRRHRAHLQPDDRAELLGRSEIRHRLPADGAIPRVDREDVHRSQGHPDPRAERDRADAARRRDEARADALARPRSTTINCAASSTSTLRRTAKSSARSRRRCKRSSTKRRSRKGCASPFAARCRR